MSIKKILRKYGIDIVSYHNPYTLLQKLHIDYILDIGANHGYFALEMRGYFPNARIYTFEPLKDCFDVLINNTWHDPHITAHNVALGDSNENSTMFKSSFHPSSSIRPMTPLHKKLYPKSAGSTGETISIRRLDDFTDLNLSGKGLVKIDVQGFEKEVLLGGKNVLKNTTAIMIENSYIPLYKNQALFGEVENILLDLGFLYFGSIHQHTDNTHGLPIYEDSLFLNKDVLGSFGISF